MWFGRWASRAREVGCPVEAIVERAAEVKVLAAQRPHQRAILLEERPIDGLAIVTGSLFPVFTGPSDSVCSRGLAWLRT
jgi:hypothetical protein